MNEQVPTFGRTSMNLESSTKPQAHTRHTVLVLSVATAIGFILRLCRLGEQSFWLDEVRTVVGAQLPIGSEMLHFSQAPPLFHFLLHFLVTLGTNEWLLRLPSAVMGTLSIPLLYSVGRRFVGERPALVAALLLTFSSFHLWYSQEVGYYSMALLLQLLAVLFCFRFLENGRTRDLVAHAVAVGLAIWVQYATVFLIAVLNIIALCELRKGRPGRMAWLMSQLLLGLLAGLPLYLTHYRPGMELWKGTSLFYLTIRPKGQHILAIPYAFYAFTLGQSFGPPLSEIRRLGLAGVMGGYASSVLWAAFVFSLLFLSGGLAAWKRRGSKMFYLSVFIGLPILCSLLFSVTHNIPLNPRYLISAYPPYLFLLGLGWQSLPGRFWTRGILKPMVCILIALSLYGYYFDPRYFREDARATARYLEDHVRPNDEILVLSSYFGAYAMRFYYQGSGELRMFSTDQDVRGESVREMMESLKDAPRVWLVLSRYWENDPTGMVRAYLDTVRKVCDHATYPGVEIIGYCSAKRSPGGPDPSAHVEERGPF